MSRSTLAMGVVLAAGTVSSVASAQSWATANSGSWFTASNWSPAVVPTGNGATATLGLTGAYTVNTSSNTVGGLNITNPAAVLAINGGQVFTLDGAVNNALAGTILINTSAAFSGTHMMITQPGTAFSGSGTIRLNASGSDSAATSQTARLGANGSGSLTMNAGTSIRGFGIVLNLPTTNNGTIDADVAGRPLRIDGGTHQNNATYAASAGGLLLVNAVINQGPAGTIAPSASGSSQLFNTTVNGGWIISQPTGRVTNTGTTTLSGVTIGGGIDLNGGTATNVMGPGVALSGGATVSLNTNSAFSGTYLRAMAPATPVNGGGTVRLSASPSDSAATNLTAALTSGAAGSSWVFGSGVTVAGFGIVSDVPTINNGTFNADVAGRPLRVDSNVHQNNGLYTATGGGALVVIGVTLTQAPGAAMTAVGANGDGTINSSVQLHNSSVTGGSIVSNGAAHALQLASSSLTLSDLTIAGAFDQYQGSNLYIDSPGITLNNATILVNAAAAFSGTHFRTGDAGTAINGTGTIRLNASPSDSATTSLTAAINEDGGDAGGSFVFAPGITVAGFGIISALPTVNNGLFNADVSGRPLRVEGSSHQNNNLYASNGGGLLLLSSTTVTQAGGAWVRAGDGSNVEVSNSRLNGGSLGSPNGGSGITTLSGAATLDGVAVSRQATLNASGTLAVTGNGINLINNAQVVVNTSAAFSGTRIRADGAPTPITGTGAIHLNASPSDSGTTSGTADIEGNGSVPGSAYTFGPGITIDGFGRIDAVPTVNGGRIEGNITGRPLRIDGSFHQNNAAYAASNGGGLWLVNTTVNQGAAGTVTAGDLSGVLLSGATVNGGTFNAAGSGRFTVNGVCTVGGVTSNAPIDIVGSDSLVVTAAGFVNNGLVVVNSNAAFSGTALRAAAPNTLVSGTGEVRLNRSASDSAATSGTADIEPTAAGNTFSFGAGQTVTGSGRIDGPVSMAGAISPGSPAGAVNFIRNESALSFTDSGRLVIDVASVGSFDRLVNTGSVALNGALHVNAATDFPAGTTFDVITGGTHTGEFDAVFTTGLASPKRFGARYDNAGRVRVTVLCGPADIAGTGADGNGDGVLDNNDFVVFIDRFFSQDPRADYGGTGGVLGADGQFNNNDFVVFIDLFFAGCF